MSFSEKRRFTFEWKVQNFSMYSRELGECLRSPVFVVDILKESEWCLNLDPYNGTRDFVSCFLSCRSLGSYENIINIRLSMVACSIDNTKHLTREEKDESFKVGDESEMFRIPTQILSEEQYAYLPNDTLTLQCFLWKLDAFDDVLNNEVLDTVSRNKIQYAGLLHSYGCSVVSRVQEQRKNFSWPIRRFSSISPNKRLTIRVQSALKDAPSFFLTFYKKIDNQWAEIEIRKEKPINTRTIVKCRISVEYIQKGVNCFDVDDHVFEPYVYDDVWKFPPFIEFSELSENKYLDRTEDVLYLSFEFFYSHPGDLGVVHHLEDSPSQFESFMNIYPPIEGFGQLYRDGELSDFTIRAGEREFKVHRNILHARSAVFSAMFDNDMKEKVTGVVDITDIDSDTMDRMLCFMYTNEVEDIQTEGAIKLYSAADKYEVLPLKVRCTWILASTLSVSNVCDVLRLADIHHAESLHDLAVGFVRANSYEIFQSSEWEDLMKGNSSIAAKVMHEMLVEY